MADDDTSQDAAKAPSGLDIDWVRTIAGALAAITTAVLLSTLGAAGTLIGAALGSVAATVGTAVYSQGLARSRAKLAEAQERALHKVGEAQAEVRRAARRGDPSRLPRAEAQLAEAADELDPSADGPGADDGDADSPTWRERLAVLPWKRITLVAGGLFLLVVVVISVFEALTGRTVSSYTGGSDSDGGTTITRITGGGGGSGSDDDGRDGGPRDPQQSPADPSGSTTPSDGGTPSTDPVPSSEAPTEDPSTEPSVEPTPEVPTPTPSAPLPSPTGTP
ncbi:hypothetical protein [Nocardioides abyssi]|uniref:Uncharacterized protein n=1 Tax=Nocardioides abyssi TaxID=3058370 RepID=A0ABT8EPC8_9ACTN|nr:hypothetical protein [Nocardioides abyssi]MDN4159985.1 hypothetical protein [Nocardioides abyssi]